MWQPAASNKHPAHTVPYVDIPLAPPLNTRLLPDESAAVNLLNLHKLHLAEMLTASSTTPCAANAQFITLPAPPSTATAAAAAAAMYYNAAALLQNTPLGVMTHLQQYLQNEHRSPSSSSHIVSTNQWSLPAFHHSTIRVANSNDHLLLARKSNSMSTPKVSSTTPTSSLHQDDPKFALINPLTSSTPPNVLDMLSMDILTDTFMRLNALHLSNPAAVQPTFQHLLQPLNTTTIPPATAAASATSNRYGSATRETAPMLSQRPSSSSAAPLQQAANAAPALPVLPAHLFKPYFHMDHHQQQMTALNTTKSTTLSTSSAAASLSPSPPATLRKGGVYNYSSSAMKTFKTSSSTRHKPSISTMSSLSSSSINCDLKRAVRKRTSDLLELASSGGLRSKSSHLRERDESLLPPPKKKWIRHYLKEDIENNTTSLNATTTTTNTTSYLLVSSLATASTTSNSSTSSSTQAQHEQDDDDTMVKLQQTCPQKSPTTTKFTLIDSNGEIIGNASTTTTAASKQMLLANAIRIAPPTTTTSTVLGVGAGGGGGGGPQLQSHVLGLSKTISSIPLNAKNLPIITTAGLPYHHHMQSPHHHHQQLQQTNNGGLNRHHKQFTPLTPPPMASRKFVEPSQSRIRSFSMSSHKFSANHQMHVQNSNGNSNCSTSMMVDDIPPTQQHNGFSTASGLANGQQHSPPRQGGGNHYMHMMSQQAGAAGGNLHAAHVAPRRRTISSTSNGAGTREVHNKLEKNRRAHLKECYEALKNQLSLKDEDRRKTSNLAILGEALKCVQTYQKRNHELEAEWEHLANDKINLQKRIVSLKRELGSKYEQIFSGIFPDIEIGSIPSERDTITDSHSLSSGRGSTLYSSSSSLSSGGSNGSNSNGSSHAMSSPVGAGLQTAMPTAISPVIAKINNTNISNNSNCNSSTSPISINSSSNNINNNNNNIVMQHQRKHPTTTIATSLQSVTIPTQVVVGGAGGGGAAVLASSASILGGNNIPTAVSPTASLVTFGGSSLPLSLTAKNISATAITRGSPTPSTPSPSPSSSSGVSSSSSLISSSPPINGVINNNGRNVTVNIPNGLKLQAAAANSVGIVGGNLIAAAPHAITGTIGNGPATATATLIATSAPAQGVSNTNNAAVLTNHITQCQQQHHQNQQQQQLQYNNARKKSFNVSNNSNNNHVVVETALSAKGQHTTQHLLQQHPNSPDDGEQPAKFLKVFNGGGEGGLQEYLSKDGQKINLTSNLVAGGECFGSGIGMSNLTLTNGKFLTNGSSTSVATMTANELCRLPGGAELNILPPISSSNNNQYSTIATTAANGLKSSGSLSTSLTSAFYHTNGKITFVNGPATSSVSNGTCVTTTNGILLKDSSFTDPAPSSVTTSVLLAATGGSPTTTTTSPSSNPTLNHHGLHFAGNFAQLLAAANNTSSTASTKLSTSAPHCATGGGFALNGISAMANGALNVSSLSLSSSSPHVTASSVAMSKTKTNSKTSIVGWRSGAATTIN